MGDVDFSYRAMYRFRRILPDGPSLWSEWRTIYTGRGGGREYQTIGAARGVLTREKRENRRRSEWMKDREVEYKIQRRPKGDWEDV